MLIYGYVHIFRLDTINPKQSHSPEQLTYTLDQMSRRCVTFTWSCVRWRFKSLIKLKAPGGGQVVAVHRNRVVIRTSQCPQRRSLLVGPSPC